ncbi:MAG TPA: SDR family oxidoreductase [Acidimicrobiales bacterium]|nr:SDR family oxidoreductase [Acidimicrobiales bacterium]
MDIQDRVVVVTGGGAGIGEALAQAAACRSARAVIVADINGEKAKNVATEIGGESYQVDVSIEEEIISLVNDVEKRHGPIGLFCSNAGFVTSAGLEDPNERIQKMWEVHVMSHIYAARAVLPQMIANQGGYLLNTASAAGLLTQIGSLSYSITKSAAVSLGEWLSISHYHQGIRVSVLCPQAVRTDILINSPDNAESSNDAEWEEGGVASSDGILESEEVAESCMEAISKERFLVLPHKEVHDYVQFKASDMDKWLSGMRRFQDKLYVGQPLPGDSMKWLH